MIHTWDFKVILLLKHHFRIIQLNLRDRDNLQTKDKRPVPKVSFVWKFDCIADCELVDMRRPWSEGNRRSSTGAEDRSVHHEHILRLSF